MHVENLATCLQRGALHAPKHVPSDGLKYKTIHNVDIQQQRRVMPIDCGPGGCIHDYVSFYFGPRSPMLYQLHTGWVEGYDEGQEPIIYIVSHAQVMCNNEQGFVFSDGHGIAAYTDWYDDLALLHNLDWDCIYAEIWKDDLDHPDRQRRKQAEFLVYRSCPWDLVDHIAVLNNGMKKKVVSIMEQYPDKLQKPVRVCRKWYY